MQRTEGPPTPIEEIRGAMRLTSDPRAARTRRAIIDAVRDLVLAGEQSISVTIVVARAGISRSSFYTQFSGIEGVAFEVLTEAFADIAALDRKARRTPGARSRLATQLSLHRLVSHFADHRSLYAGLLDRPETAPAYAQAINVLAAELAAGSPPGPDPTGASLSVQAHFIAGGILAVLRAWYQGETNASVAELVEQINRLLPPWLATPADPPPPAPA